MDDRKAVLSILALSLVSIAWSGWTSSSYWLLLSTFSAALSSHALWKNKFPSRTSVLICTASISLMPIMGTIAGNYSYPLLEVVLSPLLTYSLALWLVTSTVRHEDNISAGTLAFMTLLVAVSIGTMVLLSLYYLDAILSADLIHSNSALMWPLSSLVIGSVAISAVVRIMGYEEGAMGMEEAKS